MSQPPHPPPIEIRTPIEDSRPRVQLVGFDAEGLATDNPDEAVTVEWINRAGNTVAARQLASTGRRLTLSMPRLRTKHS
jgi:hypothetical protein